MRSRRRSEQQPPDGRNLVFLVSQPRSGSTLLQRLLGKHQSIHTTSEPWIMLHPLLALDQGAFTGRHDARIAHRALTDFIGSLSDGIDAYYTAVAKFADHLYGVALAESGATLFLDKTPRYYMILDELAAVFPAARFVFLVRNPAAVISSVYSTWVKPNPMSIRRYRADLLSAPGVILNARDSLGSKAMTVRYEELVASSDQAVDDVLGFLGLPTIGVSGHSDLPQFALGDQKSVYAHDEPQASFRDRWRDDLGDPQLRRWVVDYMDLLGDKTVAAMGYDSDEVRSAARASGRLVPPDTVALTRALGVRK